MGAAAAQMASNDLQHNKLSLLLLILEKEERRSPYFVKDVFVNVLGCGLGLRGPQNSHGKLIIFLQCLTQQKVYLEILRNCIHLSRGV